MILPDVLAPGLRIVFCSAAQAAFMADFQLSWGVAALEGKVTAPAWKSKPSWYLVTADDKMIPAPAQRQMATRAGATVVETAGSHAVYVSNPKVAADLIKQAAKVAAKYGADRCRTRGASRLTFAAPRFREGK